MTISEIWAKPSNDPGQSSQLCALTHTNSFPEPHVHVITKTRIRGKSNCGRGPLRGTNTYLELNRGTKTSPGPNLAIHLRCYFSFNSGKSHWCCPCLSQDTMEKVSMPSLSLLPAISRTATWLITTTSWRISSCKWLVKVYEGEEGEEGNSGSGETASIYSLHQEPQLEIAWIQAKCTQCAAADWSEHHWVRHCPQHLHPRPINQSIQTFSVNYASDGLTTRLEHMYTTLNSW